MYTEISIGRKRRSLKVPIKRSKIAGIKKLCDDANSNLWRGAYRLVVATLKRSRMEIPNDPLFMNEAVEILFPKHELPGWRLGNRNVEGLPYNINPD